MTWRERIADWITRGELTRARARAEHAEKERSAAAFKLALAKYFQTLKRMEAEGQGRD